MANIEDVIINALVCYRDIWLHITEPLDSNDIGLIKADISGKVKEGWNGEEIYNYLKNMEEVDPNLNEDVALHRMQTIIDNVTQRLKK